MAISTSLAVCPVNFKEFDKIKAYTDGNIEAALLLSKINFHLKHTKITKDGKACIARSREHIASWFGFGLKKVDRLLSFLDSKELIQKKISTWYGAKRLFISSTKEYNIPVNVDLLKNLTELTGSVKGALLFSKIAFKFANTTITHDGLNWCCIKKEDLSRWSGLSIRTIDNILKTLERKGLILKKIFSYYGKTKCHFHIPDHVISLMGSKKMIVDKSSKNTAIHSQNYRPRPAKNQLSIRIRTNTKKTNNNTASRNINFKNKTFPEKQKERYVKAALKKTIEKFKLKVSSPKDLMDEVMFSINDPKQGRGVSCFKHAVNRTMAIIRDGNWRTPIGFYNHSQKGRKKKESITEREKQWERVKNKDCAADTNPFLQSLNHTIPSPHDEDLKKICEQYKKISEFFDKNSSIERYQEGLLHKIKVLLGKGANQKILNAYIS